MNLPTNNTGLSITQCIWACSIGTWLKMIVRSISAYCISNSIVRCILKLNTFTGSQIHYVEITEIYSQIFWQKSRESNGITKEITK